MNLCYPPSPCDGAYGYCIASVLSALYADPPVFFFAYAGGLHFTPSVGPRASHCGLCLLETFLHVAFLPLSHLSFRGRT